MMNRLAINIFYLITALIVSGCWQSTDDSVKSKYEELGWIALKPEKTQADQDWQSDDANGDWYSDDYGQGPRGLYSVAPLQSSSSSIVPEINGKDIRVPGFVVPVEFGAGNLVSEFFLVPYFGACFHKPPPPPNQTIYVKSAEPIQYESIYDPVWIMGKIKTEQVGNEIATAAYTMDLDLLEPYIE